MRSTVAAAPFVCSVAITRIPISAAVIAVEMVSRSRSSPTRITSGSSRRADSRAVAKDSACTPTSRWLIRQFLRGWTNSIGSSIVRMWPLRRALMSSIIAASVVDLPEPVLPVTRISRSTPWQRFRTASGILSCSRVCAFDGIARNTPPMPFSCRRTLTRKRAIVAQRVGEIGAVACLEAVERLARHDLVDRLAHEVRAEALGPQVGASFPYWRMRGGSPAMKCRSEPSRFRISSRYSSIFAKAAPHSRVSNLRQQAAVHDVLREEPLVASRRCRRRPDRLPSP